jgi:hypothetical protein
MAEVSQMVDHDKRVRPQAGTPPLVPAKQAVAERIHPGRKMTPLGEGTADHTYAGAAYRGREVAAARGEPGPEEMGIGTNHGLGYVSEPEERTNDYSRAQNEGE